MKVKIISSSQKKGVTNNVPWCISKLFVSVANAEDANSLAIEASKTGATKEQIGTFIKKHTYKDNITYQFNLECSSITINNVEQFGILDIKLEHFGFYIKSDYVNVKIKVIKGLEMISGYESPHQEATGWANEPPHTKMEEPIPFVSKAEPNPISDPFAANLDPNDKNDLPF